MDWYGKNDIEKLKGLPDYTHVSKKDSGFFVALTELAKKNPLFRKLSRQAVFVLRKLRYDKIRRSIETDEKVILFSTFAGRGYSDSPKAIYQYMLGDERFKDYTFVWSFQNPKDHLEVLDNPNTYVVQTSTLMNARLCARAKYWFSNYRMPSHMYPKKDQVYIQLWHGTPLKRLGYDIEISDNAMNSKKEIRMKYLTDAKKFKYILAPSEFAAKCFSSAWNLKEFGKEDTMLIAGYPRNDFLINHTEQDVKNIKERFNFPEGKKIILYAPTWRDNQYASELGYVYTPEADFDKLQAALSEEYIILFRAHYLVASSFDFARYEGFVWDVSSVSDINELYVIADMLVTDYSSVFFDYANLKRPVLFYMYDYEAYANDIRGFYIDTDELPGKIVKTTDALVEAIRETDIEGFAADERYERFNEKFNYLDDGNASKRVVEAVVEEIQE
jgi:CDP-glycerol glycerophosphotransferase